MKPETLVFQFEMPTKSVRLKMLIGETEDVQVEVWSGQELIATISEELDSGLIGQFDFLKRIELLFGILQAAIVMNPEREWHKAETLQGLVEAAKAKVIERAAS